MRRLSTLALATALVAPALPATAAEISDVIDAFDAKDPYDFTAEITYSRALRRAKITREYNCDPLNPQRPGDADTCPDADPTAGALVHVKEMRYERVTHLLSPRLRFGIWHDLELSVDMPITLSEDQELRFAGSGGVKNGTAVDGSISTMCPGGPPNDSTTSPAENREDLYCPTQLPTRAGFGDMLFTVRYSPFNQQRDDARPTWTLEVGYRAPTGEIMKADNEGVGRGVHELVLSTTISRRFQHIDPYTRFEVVFPFPASDSLFKDYKFAQDDVGPGARGGFDVGMEIIPFEDQKKNLKFFLDLGIGLLYHGAGRDYSELFDALALGAQTCDPNGLGGDENCAIYNPESNSELRNTRHDGITTVEQYMTAKVHFGLGLLASKYFRIGVDLSLAHDTEHFLSSADIGRDLDGSGLVESRTDPHYNADEHNPTYVAAIDAVGRRLRVEETTVFTAAFKAAFQF